MGLSLSLSLSFIFFPLFLCPHSTNTLIRVLILQTYCLCSWLCLYLGRRVLFVCGRWVCVCGCVFVCVCPHYSFAFAAASIFFFSLLDDRFFPLLPSLSRSGNRVSLFPLLLNMKT